MCAGPQVVVVKFLANALLLIRPGHSPVEWCSELQEALALGVPHISLYELTVEKGTKLHRMVEKKRTTMPQDDDVCTCRFCGTNARQ